MASRKQSELFENLLNEKDFGDKDINELREQFNELTKKNASEWIERALELDDKDEEGGEVVNPPF